MLVCEREALLSALAAVVPFAGRAAVSLSCFEDGSGAVHSAQICRADLVVAA